jgi:hypothetical protein
MGDGRVGVSVRSELPGPFGVVADRLTPEQLDAMKQSYIDAVTYSSVIAPMINDLLDREDGNVYVRLDEIRAIVQAAGERAAELLEELGLDDSTSTQA